MLTLPSLAKWVDRTFVKKDVVSTNIVLIGDSFLRGTGADHGWGYYLKETLGTSANIYEYGNSGGGFIATGHTDPFSGMTFKDQLTYASTHSGQNDAVDTVVISGSGNDHTKNYDAIQKAVVDTVRHAKSLFKNAKVIILPLQCEYKSFDETYIKECSALIRGGYASGAVVCESSWWWVMGENDVISADNSHPNNRGYQIMGQKLASFLNGGNVSSYTQISDGGQFGSTVTDSTFRCVVKDGIVYLQGTFKVPKIDNSILLYTLPKSMRLGRDSYDDCIISGGSFKTTAPIFFQASTGNIYCRTPPGGSYPTGSSLDIDIGFISYPLGLF